VYVVPGTGEEFSGAAPYPPEEVARKMLYPDTALVVLAVQDRVAEWDAAA
jgi:hypothetical protein